MVNILGTQNAFAETIKYVELVHRDWEKPNHWEPARVPNQDDDILIDAAISGVISGVGSCSCSLSFFLIRPLLVFIVVLPLLAILCFL